MSRFNRIMFRRPRPRMHSCVAVVSIALLGGGLAGCSQATQTDSSGTTTETVTTSALDKDEIVIGYDNTFVPMGFDDQGETKGFDIDLAKAAEKKLGKKFRFQNIDWNLKETELNTGKIDAIWNGYSYSDERAKKVGMTDPYMENLQVLLVLADSPIQTKSDLAGKTLAVQAGSTGAELVASDPQFQSSLTGGQPAAYDTFDQALRDVEVGRADAVLGDSILLTYYAKQKGEKKFRVLEDHFGEEKFVVAVRLDDTKFRDALNGFLKEAKTDGTIEKLSQKWFK